MDHHRTLPNKTNINPDIFSILNIQQNTASYIITIYRNVFVFLFYFIFSHLLLCEQKEQNHFDTFFYAVML